MHRHAAHVRVTEDRQWQELPWQRCYADLLLCAMACDGKISEARLHLTLTTPLQTAAGRSEGCGVAGPQSRSAAAKADFAAGGTTCGGDCARRPLVQ